MISYYSTLLGCGPVGWESNGSEESVSVIVRERSTNESIIVPGTHHTHSIHAFISSLSLYYCIRITHIYLWHVHQQILRHLKWEESMGFGSTLNNAMYVSNRDNPGEEKPQVRLDTLSGTCLGVDLLCVLHAALFSSHTSVVYNDESNIVEVEHDNVTKYLTKWYQTHSFVSLGITLICVLDGFKDPAKEKNVRPTRSSRFLRPEELRDLQAQIEHVRKKFDTLDSLDISEQETAHKKLVIEQRELMQKMRRGVKLTERVIFEAVRWCRSHDGVDNTTSTLGETNWDDW